MTLTQLEYIVTLDTYRHFVTASEKCFVSQPTLSMQIQKLEHELGVLIFDRKKQPIEPTIVGKEVIQRARQVLREAQGITSFVNAEKNIVEGDFRLGIIPTLAPYLLPLFLGKMLQKYPKIRLVIEELQTEDLVQKLHSNELDAGILVTPLGEKNLQELPLFEERFVAYISESHSLYQKSELQVSDLEANDLWILNEGHCFRSQVLNICKSQDQKDKRFIYESGSIETLRKMVERESGYTLLPELALTDVSSENEHLLRYFTTPEPVREVSIVVHSTLVKMKQVNILQQSILDCLPEHIKSKDSKKQVIRWR